MCMYFDVQQTIYFKEKIKNQKYIYLYKVAYISYSKQLISPYQQTEYKIGKNIDEEFEQRNYKNGETIFNCFHCFQSLEDAKYYKDSIINSGYLTIIKIKVLTKDVFYVGFSSNTFESQYHVGIKAFTLSKSEYNKAINETITV